MRNLFFCILLGLMVDAFAQNVEDHSLHGQPVSKKQPSVDEARVPIDIPIEKQAKMGLKVAKVEKKKVEYTLRTIGIITANEAKEAHVHTKVRGWIEHVYADSIGVAVKKGKPLYDLYSPDLVATEEEFLSARQEGFVGREIAVTARNRLLWWGVPQTELKRLDKTGKVNRTVTFNAPIDGFVIEKKAVQGMYVMPEMELYRISDLSSLWMMATVYESDIAAIAKGDEVAISLVYEPDKLFTGKVSYIYPEIEKETRTAKARIEIENLDEKLKPGMTANVTFKKNMGESVVVSENAVLNTGVRNIVFVKTGTSRFEPRVVKVGPRVENNFIVLEGLLGGEEVVIGAHFLIDAESKFQAASQSGSKTQTGHAGHEGM